MKLKEIPEIFCKNQEINSKGQLCCLRRKLLSCNYVLWNIYASGINGKEIELEIKNDRFGVCSYFKVKDNSLKQLF